jgi:ABC-type long-subunit fatty acid transport system fused permease/ATPase subunit
VTRTYKVHFFFSLSLSFFLALFILIQWSRVTKDVNVTLPAASRSYNKSLLYNNEYYSFYTYAHICVFLSFIASNEPCDEHWHYIGDKKRKKKGAKKLFVKHVTLNGEKTRRKKLHCFLTVFSFSSIHTHIQYTTYIHSHSRCFFF